MAGTSHDAGVDLSQRSKGKAALGRRSFGESQYLRQVGVENLRLIISGEGDEAEGASAASEIDVKAAEKSPASKASPQDEEEKKSSALTLPPPPPPPPPPVETTPSASACSMNRQLWGLEERRALGDCDTSKPPGVENQVDTTAHGGGGPPPFSRDALTKILTARHMLDKRSLLEYALYVGKAEHFEHLACWIRWKLGTGGLVSQLRDPGVNRAPLLFQAVTSSACFEAAKAEIKGTVGVGGLTQQVRATDQRGMNLLMYAARHAGGVEVFASALELVEALTKQDVAEGLTHQEHGVGQLRHWDMHGKNLLHHAAEGRSEEMLSKVIDAIQDLRILEGAGDNKNKVKVGLLHHLTTKKDSGVPSPDLCALGRRWTSRVMLGDRGVERMERTASAFDEFKCAARGGEEAFEFVCQRHEQGGGGPEEGWLLAALGLDSLPVPPEKPDKPTEARYTLLLARAALGGDEVVLEKVTRALCGNEKDLRQELARKSDYPMTESDFLRAVHEARSASPPFEYTGHSAGDGGSSGSLEASLFTLAVLSRSTKAVDWVAKFVIESVTDAGQAWCALRGWVFLDGREVETSSVSSLAFAAAVSGSGEGRGVFEAACDALRKAANNCERDPDKADELLRGVLVGEPPSPARFTPFDVAGFSGNPARLHKVEEAYKRGAAAEDNHGGRSSSTGGGRHSRSREEEEESAGGAGGGFKKDEVKAHVEAVLQMKEKARQRRRGGNKTKPIPAAAAAAAAADTAADDDDVMVAVAEEKSGPVRAASDGGGGGASDSTIPPCRPEVGLLLRCCRGTAGLKGFLEAVKDDEFSASVESEELRHSVRKAKKASLDGSFESLRALIAKGWDCHGILGGLINKIGDYEEDIIDVTLCAIENATNPFVTAAIASNEIRHRHRYTPRDRNGLDNLQERIDALTAEILNRLPQTVRGLGSELVGSYLDNERYSDRGEAVMANLAGYIAVRWMLEPSLHEEPTENESACCVHAGFSAPFDRDIDPLQQALSRGSAAGAFINSPLVLDYMELKWTCTVPSWGRRNPFDYAINEGFYTYGSEKPIVLRGELQKSGSKLDGSLLRLLQGWDLGIPPPSLRLTGKRKKKAGRPERETEAEAAEPQGGPHEQRQAANEPRGKKVARWIAAVAQFLRGFPRTTVLPGFQFILAGMIGKPDQFFLIPFVRFFFETTSYLFMLGLYCSCVTIETSSEIPMNEIFFYVFVAGLLMREVMEFKEAIPPVQVIGGEGESAQGTSGRSHHRATSAIRGYFATDNWNILDTASILCVLVAFVFRIIAYLKDLLTDATIFSGITQQAFFIARLAMAFIAPLLFARVLSLAQVDNVLGPMTQIIWAMLFHLIRFSFFMLVVMVSFALAFHSLFSHPNCDSGVLYQSFRTLGSSLLRMFEAMLGETGFEDFDDPGNDCTGPSWEFDAGILLMVAYMLIMAILMLNLLIAVLSTAHDHIVENTMTEFHLGRSQTIQASAHSIERRRLPPPLNLLMGVLLVLVDLVGEVRHQFRRRRRCCCRSSPDKNKHGSQTSRSGSDNDGPAPASEPRPESEQQPKGEEDYNAARSRVGGEETGGGGGGDFQPLSQHPGPEVLAGLLERLLFAFTMGLVAVALSAALWAVSVLSLAGRIVRWMSMAADERRGRPTQRAGYCRQLFAGLLGLFGFVFGLFVAVLFCAFCMASSVAVWIRGICGLFEWYLAAAKQKEPLSSYGKGAVMPGALGADKEVWQDAADTVEGNNYGPAERKKEDLRGFGGDVPRHFDVGALLNLTTGWSPGHLSALVSRKDKESRKEEAMLREIDEEKRSRAKARRREEEKYRTQARRICLDG